MYICIYCIFFYNIYTDEHLKWDNSFVPRKGNLALNHRCSRLIPYGYLTDYFFIVYFGFWFLNSIAFSKILSIPEIFSYNEITSSNPL